MYEIALCISYCLSFEFAKLIHKYMMGVLYLFVRCRVQMFGFIQPLIKWKQFFGWLKVSEIIKWSRWAWHHKQCDYDFVSYHSGPEILPWPLIGFSWNYPINDWEKIDYGHYLFTYPIILWQLSKGGVNQVKSSDDHDDRRMYSTQLSRWDLSHHWMPARSSNGGASGEFVGRGVIRCQKFPSSPAM